MCVCVRACVCVHAHVCTHTNDTPARLSEDIQREGAGKGAAKHLLSTKGLHKLGQRAKEQWQQFDGKSTTLRLRITVTPTPILQRVYGCIHPLHSGVRRPRADG